MTYIHEMDLQFDLFWGLVEMQNIYEKWLSCGENWQKSTWCISLTTTSTSSRRGARRWMTFQQISAKYSSDEIAQEIVDQKMTDDFEEHRKPHPDLPHRTETFLKVFGAAITSPWYDQHYIQAQ